MEERLSDEAYLRFGSPGRQADLMPDYWTQVKFAYEQNFPKQDTFHEVMVSLTNWINSKKFQPDDRHADATWETGSALVPPTLIMAIFHGLCAQACLDRQNEHGAFYHLSRGHGFLGRLEGRVLFDERMRKKEMTARDEVREKNSAVLKDKVLELLNDTDWSAAPRPHTAERMFKRIAGDWGDWMAREAIAGPQVKGLPAAVKRWANDDVSFGLRYDSLLRRILKQPDKRTDASDRP